MNEDFVPRKVVWNVYYYSINERKIQKVNIFNHWKFREETFEYLDECADKEMFAELLRKNLMYYFWARFEYEMAITKLDGRIIVTPLYAEKEEAGSDLTSDNGFDWVGFYEWIKDIKHTDKKGSIKIDVYDQVMFRFPKFVDHCWVAKG